MSYSCDISFKKIESQDIFDFFVKFKQEVQQNFDNIAKDNYVFSPLFKHGVNIFDNKEKLYEVLDETKQWAKSSIFSYRWFYNKELQLLGVYSVHDCVQNLFDKTIYFQNSCDQDYERDNWVGIEEFEEIYDKYQCMSMDELVKIADENDSHWLVDRGGTLSDKDIEYAKKSFAYREIWDNFENTLYDEDSIVYLQLFAHYDISSIMCFVGKVKKHLQDWYESLDDKKDEYKELIMEQQEQG